MINEYENNTGKDGMIIIHMRLVEICMGCGTSLVIQI